MPGRNVGIRLLGAAAIVSVSVFGVSVSTRIAKGVPVPPGGCAMGCILETYSNNGPAVDPDGTLYEPYMAIADERNASIVGGELVAAGPAVFIDMYTVTTSYTCMQDEAGGTQQEGTSGGGMADFQAAFGSNQLCALGG